MPSASAKLEKQSSTESFDPMKQVLTLVDNKVRNLEKRKGKLDGYKADSSSGKELNEDQLNAVKKYDQVLEVLEFSRELQKNLKVINSDCQKYQKKAAKREVVEKQQEQLQRLKEVLLLQDLLNNMGNEETRQDFLNQTNGAVKLSEEELNSLDELYKLISPERDSSTDCSSFDDQMSTAAEHLLHLLDGRPKEVLGTTYKVLKEMLTKIHTSGYFDSSSGAGTTEESAPEEENVEAPQITEVADCSAPTPLPTMIEEPFQNPTEELEVPPSEDLITSAPQQNIQVEGVYFAANGANNYVTAGIQTPQAPLTEVLHGQAPINFLQDSQVDLESPHMDPAVVVAHPMAPPPPLGYHSVPFAAAPSVPQSGPVNAQSPNYEPIPTQTYTNQNFANLSNIVVPPTSPYIPVNASSGVNPLGLVGAVHTPVLTQPPPQTQPTQQPPPPQQPPMRTSPDLSVQKQDSYMKVSANEFQPNLNSSDMTTAPSHYHSSDENEEACDGFQVQQSSSSSRQGSYSNRGAGRGGPRGAPRSGTSNGYGGGRQRGSYSNNNNNNSSSPNTGGRGGYQGNYYNNHRDFNNSSSRRGGPNPRGTGGRGSGSRGGPHQAGAARGGRGGSGYRSQSQMQQQQ